MSDIRVSVRHKLEGLRRRKLHGMKKLANSPERPLLVVYRSNRHIYAQLVDQIAGRTVAGCSSLTPEVREKVAKLKGKIPESKIVGLQIAAIAKEKGISTVSFDRNGRRYHGRVKAVADGAREGGLQF